MRFVQIEMLPSGKALVDIDKLKAIKAIMRDLHLSRKVVRKAIRSPEADMGYRREVQPLPKLGPFQARLNALLEEDEARPARWDSYWRRYGMGECR